MKYGADIVVHSELLIQILIQEASFYGTQKTITGLTFSVTGATKWIGGHGTTIGGVVIDKGAFPWNNGRFPGFTKPNPAYHGQIYWDRFGYDSFMAKARAEILRNIGPCQNPFGAFLVLQGL